MVQPRNAAHWGFTIRFTSRLGTTMVFARAMPSVNFRTLGSAWAAAMMASLSASAGTTMLERSLPF